MLAEKSTSKEKHILSTAYPPLIHPIKTPLNRGILLDTSDRTTGKLLTGKQANFRESIGQYWSDNGVVTGKTAERRDKSSQNIVLKTSIVSYK